MKSIFFRAGAVLLALLAVIETAARVLLGLGSPVLYVEDPAVEYLLRPNQDVRRFGKHIVVNEYGMRSDTFPEHKADSHELRVLVMGDSVVNGGNHADQQQLATTVLRDRLSVSTHRPVIVGNVSAGSWGPQNMLAWSRKFGWFDADVVLIVLSSHDASDVPTFAGLDANAQPTVKPVSALSEGVAMAFARYRTNKSSSTTSAEVESERRPATEPALQGARELIGEAQGAGACVAMIQHFTQTELAGQPGPGHDSLRTLANEEVIHVVDDAAVLSASMQRGEAPYRDNIHLNDHGQALLAEVLESVALKCPGVVAAP